MHCKCQIASDLHVDINNWNNIIPFFKNKNSEADILLLAGDTCQDNYSKRKLFFNKHILPNYKHVIEVSGNHDFYGSHWNTNHNYNFTENNYHHLDNGVIKIEGVNFVGSTLWSDVLLNQSRNIEKYINDYHYINGFGVKISRTEFKKNTEFIFNQLENKNNLNIVITHHLPFDNLTSSEYVQSELSSAYSSNVQDAVFGRDINAKYWIHGHSHNFCEKQIYGCNFLRNPYGYEKNGENSDFKTHIITI